MSSGLRKCMFTKHRIAMRQDLTSALSIASARCLSLKGTMIRRVSYICIICFFVTLDVYSIYIIYINSILSISYLYTSNCVSEYSYIYLFIGPWTNMITYLSGWILVAFHPIPFHQATLAICKDGQRWNKDDKHGPLKKDHALVRLKKRGRFKRFNRLQCFEPHWAEDSRAHSNLKNDAFCTGHSLDGVVCLFVGK